MDKVTRSTFLLPVKSKEATTSANFSYEHAEPFRNGFYFASLFFEVKFRCCCCTDCISRVLITLNENIYSFIRRLGFKDFKYVDSTCIMHSLYIAKYSLSPVRLIYP